MRFSFNLAVSNNLSLETPPQAGEYKCPVSTSINKNDLIKVVQEMDHLLIKTKPFTASCHDMILTVYPIHEIGQLLAVDGKSGLLFDLQSASL